MRILYDFAAFAYLERPAQALAAHCSELIDGAPDWPTGRPVRSSPLERSAAGLLPDALQLRQ